MPFIVHKNCDGTFKVANADTGKVYAYATAKPTQVMSIVKRSARTTPRKSAKKSARKSARTTPRKSAKKSARKSARTTFCARKSAVKSTTRRSVRRGAGEGCAHYDIECRVRMQKLQKNCLSNDTACMFRNDRRLNTIDI
jgi:hypothetical protein